LQEIAVIAAHHAGGLIVITHFPARQLHTGFRQQPALNASGKGKIAFQGALFVLRKMVEAKPHQRVGEQAFRFDRVMAGFAKAECSAFETIQRLVHGGEQLRERSISAR